jgi:photosynthetic reaction center cytochrome c subunit
MSSPVPAIALLAAAATFGLSVAVAQPAAAPPPGPPAMTFADPPHKNLKVLPADITRQELISTMKFFSQSLGVRCTYCHVGAEGQPLSTFDFPSDAKEHKKTARDMMRLVAHLNTDHLPAITGLPDAKVTCFTCHRGSTKPATEVPAGAVLVPPPPAAARPKP